MVPKEREEETLELRRYGTIATGSFVITCDGSLKASELVKRGHFVWFDERMTNMWFRIVSHMPKTSTIVLIGAGRKTTLAFGEELEQFERLGLQRPTFEQALMFGIRYPEEQVKHPIVWLHEPIQNSVVVLHVKDGKRRLCLVPVSIRWGKDFVFGAILPKPQ